MYKEEQSRKLIILCQVVSNEAYPAPGGDTTHVDEWGGMGGDRGSGVGPRLPV